MKDTLTPQQFAFATALVHGIDGVQVTQADAYRHAYPKSRQWKDETVWSAATRLAGNSKVRSWVDSERKKIVERHEVTTDSIMRDLKDAYDIAKTQGNPAAMVSAAQAQAKLAGLWVEKRETDATVRHEKADKPVLGDVLAKALARTRDAESASEDVVH